MRRDNGREDAGEEVDVEIEVGNSGLNVRISALRILLSEDDRQELERGVLQCLLREVLLADEVEDKICLGNNDAAECNGEGEEGRQEPKYLSSSASASLDQGHQAYRGFLIPGKVACAVGASPRLIDGSLITCSGSGICDRVLATLSRAHQGARLVVIVVLSVPHMEPGVDCSCAMRFLCQSGLLLRLLRKGIFGFQHRV
jgi:hypothetical protein